MQGLISGESEIYKKNIPTDENEATQRKKNKVIMIQFLRTKKLPDSDR